MFTRNISAFNEIAVGGRIDKKLDLNAGNWRGSDGRNVAFKPGDMNIVVHGVPKEFGWADTPVTIQARDMGVWHGVAAVFTKVQ